MVTLNEVINNIEMQAEIFDIDMWDSDTGDYCDRIGFDMDGTGKLWDILPSLSRDYSEWLSHSVTYIENLTDCGRKLVKIEVSKY